MVPDEATIASIRLGFLFGAWHKERIPRVLDDLNSAYPNHIAHDPLVSIRLLRGYSLSKQGRYEKAVRCYDEAISADSKDPAAFYGKGDALLELGRHEEAVRCYDEAIRLEPDDSAALCGKADALFEQKKVANML